MSNKFLTVKLYTLYICVLSFPLYSIKSYINKYCLLEGTTKLFLDYMYYFMAVWLIIPMNSNYHYEILKI